MDTSFTGKFGAPFLQEPKEARLEANEKPTSDQTPFIRRIESFWLYDLEVF